jgi:hypothetical protein
MSKVITVLLVIAALTAMLVLTPAIGGLDDADAKRKIKQVNKCGGNTQCNNVAVQINGNHKSVSNNGDD